MELVLVNTIVNSNFLTGAWGTTREVFSLPLLSVFYFPIYTKEVGNIL